MARFALPWMLAGATMLHDAIQGVRRWSAEECQARVAADLQLRENTACAGELQSFYCSKAGAWLLSP